MKKKKTEQSTKGKTPQNERCASAVGIRFAHSSCALRPPVNVRAQWSRVRFALFSVTDKSINNLPLFLFDVNINVLYTTEASFQCTRRNRPPKNQRVFVAAGPRSKKPATSIVVDVLKNLHTTRKTRLVKTRFTWEPQSVYGAIRLIRRPDQPCINAPRQTRLRKELL